MKQERETRFVAVMAHPRSGTVYMSRLLQAFGLDVGDENRMGGDGISSFWIGATDRPAWGPDPLKYKFTWRIHLTRHPWRVLASTLACVPSDVRAIMAEVAGIRFSWRARVAQSNSRFLPEAARIVTRVYLRWNERIECRSPNRRMRVEDAVDQVAAWLNKPHPARLPPTNTNNRAQHLEHTPPDQIPDYSDEWFREHLDPHVYADVVALGREYGYRI